MAEFKIEKSVNIEGMKSEAEPLVQEIMAIIRQAIIFHYKDIDCAGKDYEDEIESDVLSSYGMLPFMCNKEGFSHRFILIFFAKYMGNLLAGMTKKDVKFRMGLLRHLHSILHDIILGDVPEEDMAKFAEKHIADFKSEFKNILKCIIQDPETPVKH